MNDTKYMHLALKAAKKYTGYTSPNPVVGAVIVKNNKIISSASHQKAGLLHAEAMALKKAGGKAKEASLYVNLEPCAHYGKTPPCVSAIIKSGVKKVIIATKDPNPLNNGKGIRALKKAGLKVVTGVLRKEATYLNRAFFKFTTTGTPYIFIKAAQTLDGKIASYRGDSKWITTEESRRYVQKLRRGVDAILVGINTVLKDNPRLTFRRRPKKKLFKIIIDPNLKIPLGANVFKEAKKVIVITKKCSSGPKKNRLKEKADILEVSFNKKKRLSLKEALRKIAKYGIVSIMVEGGGETIANFIEERLFDEIFIFVAPKIIGGREAPTFVEGKGLAKVKDAICFKDIKLERIDKDLLLKLRK